MVTTSTRTEPVPEAIELVGPPTPASAPGPSRTEPSRTDTRAWLLEAVDGRLGVVVAIAWLVLMQIAFALEPPAREAVPFIGILLEVVMYALLATMVTGLVMQRRFGLVASLGASVLATAASIACPVTGHHAFGTWWFGQMACVLALVATSVAVLHRSNAAR